MSFHAPRYMILRTKQIWVGNNVVGVVSDRDSLPLTTIFAYGAEKRPDLEKPSTRCQAPVTYFQ